MNYSRDGEDSRIRNMKDTRRSVISSFVSCFIIVTCILSLSEERADNGTTEYSFQWFIENYSYCWHKNGEKIVSPEFTADGLEGTFWTIRLYPRGNGPEHKGYISVFIGRSRADDGPEDFTLKYELSILAANGSSLNSEKAINTFKKGKGYGEAKIVQIDDVLLANKTDYLPQDTLSVRCKIWIGEGSIQRVKQILARTRFGIEHISFLHVVEGFSTLLRNQNKTVKIRSPSRIGSTLSSTLHISDDPFCNGTIIVEITPSESDQTLLRCKLALLEISGKFIPCGEADNRFDDARNNIQKLPLSLRRHEILNRRDEFLPNDTLSLLWQGIFSKAVEYERIESTMHEIPFVAYERMNDDQKKGKHTAAENLSNSSGALEDFKTLYNNHFLADVELKTKTKSFPAHKFVLCARSTVFNATLTNNMTSKVIQLNDLEDDTVQQLLLFLYSDNLEEIKWESAIKLYYAADKYKIVKLKLMCSSFLVHNLNTTTASEVLLLADSHNDSYLKMATEDFISKNEKQVFLSEEWRKLMETNSALGFKTMLLKYMREF